MILNKNLFFSMTADWLKDFIPHKSETDRTAESYTKGMAIFRRYVYNVKSLSIKTFRFSDCTFDFLLNYRNWLLDEKHYDPTTVNHRLTVVRSYFGYASARCPELTQFYLNICEVPAVRESKEIQELIENPEDLKALLSAPKNRTKFGRRDRVILGILYDSAIRAEELVTLTLRDVRAEAEQPYLFITGKGAKQREVPITPNMLPLIKAYIKEFHPAPADYDCPFIYTLLKGRKEKMTVRNVERIVSKYGEIARETHPNLPAHIYPHMLRRTRATLWYQAGVPIETIATILGHESIETTRAHYAKPSMENKRKASEKMMAQYEAEEQAWPDDEEELAAIIGIL